MRCMRYSINCLPFSGGISSQQYFCCRIALMVLILQTVSICPVLWEAYTRYRTNRTMICILHD